MCIMADIADNSSSMANEGSPSAPQITVVSEPDEGPEEDEQMIQDQDSKSNDQTRRLKFKHFTASNRDETTASVGSSSFKPQFTFGNKMSVLKPSTPIGSSALRTSFLRPPQLASPDKFGTTSVVGESSPSKSSFPLKPARLGNPFAKGNNYDESTDETADNESNEAKVAASDKATQSTLPKFVPLCSPLPSQPRVNPAPPNQVASTSTRAIGFVFGQNLHEKVTEVTSTDAASEKRDSTEGVNNGASCSNILVASNGSTENLFTSGLKKEQVEKSSDSGGESGGDRPSKSLSEAAREYEEARAIKRKYEEVAVVTGEEDEVNVLQINCKLFAFDKVKSSWVERGRGNLRLNDKDLGSGQKQSRVIMRAAGSFRVVLNTKLWPGMVVERVSSKSVRLTAMDAISGEILVFLIMASPKEADYLYNYMESRVSALKASCAENASSYPDASRSCNNGSDANSCKDRNSKLVAMESEDGGVVTKCPNRNANIKSQDSGGNGNMLGKKSGEEDSSSS